jgi:hypothetical protein
VKTRDLQKLTKELRVRKFNLFPQFKPRRYALAESCFTDRYPGFDLEARLPEIRKPMRQIADALVKVIARVAVK